MFSSVYIMSKFYQDFPGCALCGFLIMELQYTYTVVVSFRFSSFQMRIARPLLLRPRPRVLAALSPLQFGTTTPRRRKLTSLPPSQSAAKSGTTKIYHILTSVSKMLCRKKLVLFLTLTTLGLMYISANHYLSADSGKTSSPPSNEDSISSEIVKPVMNKKTQLEKYLQPLKEDNVEFRTINPVPTGNKKLGMNFIFLCTDISSRLEPFIQMHCFEDHRCNCKTCHYYVVDCKENILFSFYRVSKHVCNKLNVMF